MRDARVLNLRLIDLDRVVFEIEVDLDLANSELLVVLGDVDVFLEVARKVENFSVESNPGRGSFALSNWED